jgi:VWFA-related protein
VTARVAAIAALLSLALAPAEQQAPRFESGTDLIEVDVRVTGKNGERVLDLTRDDFVVLEDGRPQVVTHFARRAVGGTGSRLTAEATVTEGRPPLPELDASGRLVVLAVDTQSLEPATFLVTRQKVAAFVDGQLGPDDEVALVTTNGLMLQPFTRDRGLLRRAVDRIRAADMKASAFAERPEMSTYQADLILRNDQGARQEYARRLLMEDRDLPPQMVEMITNTRARRIVAEGGRKARNTLDTLDALVRPLVDFPGRKVLVLLSNGFFTREEERAMIQGVTSTAARAGVVIYSVDTRGLVVSSPLGPIADASVGGRPGVASGVAFDYTYLGFEADRNGLNALAKDTGGLPLFDRDVGVALQNMLTDSEAGYVLGYEPPASAGDDRYHKIEVKVPGRKGLEIRAQRGYFGKAAEAKRAGAGRRSAPKAAALPADPLRDALVSIRPRHDLAVELGAGYADTEAGPTLVVTAVVPPPASPAAARKVDVLGVIYAEDGQPLFNFSESQEAAAGGRITFDTHTAVSPGRYQVRAAASEGGRFGTASVWTEVPDPASGTFVLTDVFVVEGDAPARPVRSGQRFPRQSDLEFTLFACNAKADAARHADVAFTAKLLSGERTVAADAPFVVTIPSGDPRPRRVGFSRGMPFSALEPGEYLFRITVADRIGGATAEREISFRVE